MCGGVCIYIHLLVKFRYQYPLSSLVILHFIVGSSFADLRLQDFIQNLTNKPWGFSCFCPFSIVLSQGFWSAQLRSSHLKDLPAEPSPYFESDLNAYYMAPSIMLFSSTSDALSLSSSSFHYILYYLFVR